MTRDSRAVSTTSLVTVVIWLMSRMRSIWMHDSGDYTIVEIAEMFNISRPTVYRTLERVPAADLTFKP